MKKLFILIAFALSLNANAQWSESVTEADELTGEQAETHYIYDCPEGMFRYDKESSMFIIGCKEGIMNTQFSSHYHGAQITVGLYSEEGKLIDKFNMWLDQPKGYNQLLATRNASGMNAPVGQASKVRKIYKHLVETKGSIRFIAPRYGKSNLDLRVPYIELQ